MNATRTAISESSIPIDWRGCSTADYLFLRDSNAWLAFDSWDKRSKGFDSLVVRDAWDFYGENDSSCNVFDAQDRHIGAAWVEAAYATHPSGADHILIYLGFRTDIPWVKCPDNLNKVYAIEFRQFYQEDYLVSEVIEAFATRLIDNVISFHERGLTPTEN